MNATAPKPIRSPSYPNMSLREAIERIGRIESQYRSSPVDRVVAARLIGYQTSSGPANAALAALAAYGLLERAGKGEARVTERARDILHAENEDQRRARVNEAAIEPPLFRELRERFASVPVPPLDGVITYLNRQGFNPNAVRPAAKAFLETMSYLEEMGDSESHGGGPGGGPESGSDHEPEPGKTFGGAAVGDLVQWEASGTLRLPETRRVRAVSDDGKWVFVEQSETGIPMSEIIVEEKAKVDAPQPPTLPLQTVAAASRKEVFALDEGDVVVAYPENLSPASFHELEQFFRLVIRKAQRRSGALDFFVEVYAPTGIVPKSIRYFGDFASLFGFVEWFMDDPKGQRKGDILRVHLPSRATDEDRRKIAETGAQAI